MWWDRIADRSGRPVRQDVRAAANEIWEAMRSATRQALGEDWDAGEIMELSVEAVSQYLNRRDVGLFLTNVAGILTVAFRRQLRKRWFKQQRIQLVGNASELELRYHSPDCFERVEKLIDLKKIVARMSARSQNIFLLRREGFDWKTIAEELGIAESTCQNSFWREIRQAQSDLLTIPQRFTLSQKNLKDSRKPSISESRSRCHAPNGQPHSLKTTESTSSHLAQMRNRTAAMRGNKPTVPCLT